MIISTLTEADAQTTGSAAMKTALDFLKANFNGEITEGRFEVDDGELFGYSQVYQTELPGENVVYEVHRRYIDVQYIISGSETMRWLPLDELSETQPYDVEGDYLLGIAGGSHYSEISFREGQIMVMYPGDAHAACLASPEGVQEVRKLVVKVPICEE
ncbi:YhcH/YjgK/YiaL family protein [Verrucomicrobiaceae bacterium N1E253]|uniref:YhcH/YjgK/YiaL family protein n=1 Tax=Oceaniferula marina TaxID=2748318 RepID=A0A851GBQ4_9BACT|nr:YhcH/YjgK/YiaL family protein [Oceaniferula marina]NWK55168.1 YhcH/YjgK/YiaL family protein [Oceaniferula marina]